VNHKSPSKDRIKPLRSNADDYLSPKKFQPTDRASLSPVIYRLELTLRNPTLESAQQEQHGLQDFESGCGCDHIINSSIHRIRNDHPSAEDYRPIVDRD